MQAAVVGHIEWVTFLRLDRDFAQGAIAHATTSWEEPAGGGGVASVELARLAGSCSLFTALGDDDLGRRARAVLEQHGVCVHAAARPSPQRRAVTLIEPSGERSIVVVGTSVEPRASDPIAIERLGLMDAVYLCKADAALVRAARAARVLVATARILPVLKEAAVPLDALVHSAHDEGECYSDGDLAPSPRLVVSTRGACGGTYRTESGETGAWQAADVPSPVRDTYGAGDSFAAGLTFALGQGRPAPEALRFAAERGALALSRDGSLDHPALG